MWELNAKVRAVVGEPLQRKLTEKSEIHIYAFRIEKFLWNSLQKRFPKTEDANQDLHIHDNKTYHWAQKYKNFTINYWKEVI